MAMHMSIRLAWHSDGWNGHFCKKPCENTFCVGQHSYPGDLIAGTRNLEFESEHAGEPCAKYPCGAACGLSVNAFGKDPITVKVDPPTFWKSEDAASIDITLPPSTVCTWCYEAMYNDDVETRGESTQKYNYDKRKAGAERYFAQFEPGKSLILYAPDGTMFLPDFTVTFRGEEYYWEHVGRTNDPAYMAHWAKKEAWYNKHFPGKLITTFEGNELTTDADAVIERYR